MFYHAALAAVILSWTAASSAGGHQGGVSIVNDYVKGDIVVEAPWARATPGKVRTGAAFMVIRNGGGAGDRLIGVDSGAAKKTQLHRTSEEDGIMKMRHVMAIEVKAHAAVRLEPGGYHVMFMGLGGPLKMGEAFAMTLTFEKAGPIEVMVKVMKAGAMGIMDHQANPCMKN
ncbi:MAG: copper chaperone PCu(A)C [Rhodospirillales bacterium]